MAVEEKESLQSSATPMADRAAAIIAEAAIQREKKKHRHCGWWVVLAILLILLLGCCGICAAARYQNEIVYVGTSVYGVELGGGTREQAQECWAKNQQSVYDNTAVEITCQGELVETVSLAALGAALLPEDAAQNAWEACHTGNFFVDGWLLARSWLANWDFTAQWGDVCELTPALTMDNGILSQTIWTMSETKLNTVVDGAYVLEENGSEGSGLYLTKPRDGHQINAEELIAALGKQLSAGDLSPVECSLQNVSGRPLQIGAIYEELHGTMAEARYDHTTGHVTESRVGVEFSVEDVEAQLNAAVPGTTFRADAEVVFPKASTQMLDGALFRDVLGTATTHVTGSSARIHNVYLAAQMINGRVYNPGEEFWYNATVGQRTEERGFGAAPAYLLGKTVNEVGGGICQVSSTLYYATLLANMKIVLRYCHQFVPAYITWGCDATVSWQGPDFAFRNNSDYPIEIVTEWSDNNDLTVTIMGTKVDDTYVKIESYTRSRTDYHTVYNYNETLVGKDDVEIQTPYTGYFVETYRCLYDGNDNLISREYEAKSDYEARDRIIETGNQEFLKELAAKNKDAA